MAKSFERIHSGNLVNFGILPLVFKSEADYDRISQGMYFSMTGLIEAVKRGSLITVNTGGTLIELELLATQRQRGILLAGGLLNYTRNSI